MRAAVFHGPGDVRIEARAEPRPGPGDLLVEVARAAICGTDAAEYDHGPVLVSLQDGPVVLGHEFAGRVVAVGADVEGFALGDRVVTGAGVSCGVCDRCREGRTNLCARYYTVGLHVDGGLAERVAVPAGTCARVPASCSDAAAALAQPLAVALHALDRGEVGPGSDVVVHGTGGIGAFAVAGAVARGAARVTAVDVSPRRLEIAARLGAAATLDARSADVAGAVLQATGGEGADVVVEASGAPHAPALCVALTRRGGRVVLVGLQRHPVSLNLLDLTLREVDLRPTVAHVAAVNLPEALEILADGRVAEAVVDRTLGLDELVDRGLRALVAGEVDGKILVDPRA